MSKSRMASSRSNPDYEWLQYCEPELQFEFDDDPEIEIEIDSGEGGESRGKIEVPELYPDLHSEFRNPEIRSTPGLPASTSKTTSAPVNVMVGVGFGGGMASQRQNTVQRRNPPRAVKKFVESIEKKGNANVCEMERKIGVKSQDGVRKEENVSLGDILDQILSSKVVTSTAGNKKFTTTTATAVTEKIESEPRSRDGFVRPNPIYYPSRSWLSMANGCGKRPGPVALEGEGGGSRFRRKFPFQQPQPQSQLPRHELDEDEEMDKVSREDKSVPVLPVGVGVAAAAALSPTSAQKSKTLQPIRNHEPEVSRPGATSTKGGRGLGGRGGPSVDVNVNVKNFIQSYESMFAGHYGVGADKSKTLTLPRAAASTVNPGTGTRSEAAVSPSRLNQMLDEQRAGVVKDKKLKTKLDRIISMLLEMEEVEVEGGMEKEPTFTATPTSIQMATTTSEQGLPEMGHNSVKLPEEVKVCPPSPSATTTPGPKLLPPKTTRVRNTAGTGNGTMVKSFVESYERNVAIAAAAAAAEAAAAPSPAVAVQVSEDAAVAVGVTVTGSEKEEKLKIKTKFQLPGSLVVIEDTGSNLFYKKGNYSKMGPDNSGVFTLSMFALDFVWQPTPFGFNNSARVVKSRKGIDLQSTYSLFLAREGRPEILILTAKRSVLSKDYTISTNPSEISSKSKYCAGVLEFTENKTHVLKRPAQLPYPFQNQNPAQNCKVGSWLQLLAIKFSQDPKTFGFSKVKQPCRVRVRIPKLKSDMEQCNPGSFQFPTLDRDTDELLMVKNRLPRYNGGTGSYEWSHDSLTRSRPLKSGTKSFQLAYKDQDLDLTLLQFGKSEDGGSGNFFLDFTYPFCPLQAFAVALSTFDGK